MVSRRALDSKFLVRVWVSEPNKLYVVIYIGICKTYYLTYVEILDLCKSIRVYHYIEFIRKGGKMKRIIDWFLDNIKENGKILWQIDNVNCIYKGIQEDTITGRKEVFYIERKIK